MFTKSAQLKRSSLSLSIAAAIAGMTSGVVSVGAYAQAAPDQLDEVLVTGSRIVRRDYEVEQPDRHGGSAAFEAQTGLNVESYLNQLPNYNPAATPTTSQVDVQITPVNSVGIASISLRGFGPNRSLVLVDGRRVPINALMVTDINGDPVRADRARRDDHRRRFGHLRRRRHRRCDELHPARRLRGF